MRFEEENNNLRNRPQFAPGLNDDDDDDLGVYDRFDDDDRGMIGSSYNFNSTPFGSSFNPQQPSPFGQSASPFGQPVQPQNQQKTTEDIFWEGASGAVKGAKNFAGAVHEVCAEHTYMTLAKSTRIMLYTSFIGSIVAIFLLLFSLVLPVGSLSLGMLIGCMMNMGIGAILNSVFYNKGLEEMRYGNKPSIEDIYEDEPQPQPMYQSFDEDEDEEEDITNSWGFDDDDEEEEEDNFSWDDEEDDDDDFSWNDEDDEDEMPSNVPAPVDMNNAIADIPSFDQHTQTRSALYEMYMKVLPKINPNFNIPKNLNENSETYHMLQGYINQICDERGYDEDDFILIENIQENDFMFTIRYCKTCPDSYKKVQEIADSLVNRLTRDSSTGQERPEHYGMYAETAVSEKVFIFIYKGGADRSVIVGLGDVLPLVKDTVLNPKLQAPVIYGINKSGTVIKGDYIETESQLVVGATRSGKSWQVQSIITQMCMFNSPRDIAFEAYDPKNGSSDLRAFCNNLPHFRVFRGNARGIAERLEYIVTEEAQRRQAILDKYTDRNILNIADVHKYCPEEEMPYLYLVFDELASTIGTLKNIQDEAKKDSHDKTIYRRFVNNLIQVITKYPNLGIRVIIVAHKLVDDLIPAKVYTQINARMYVRIDKLLLTSYEKTYGSKFKVQLLQKGDIAIKDRKFGSAGLMYCHGLAITTTNTENADFLRYIGQVWKKFEPEYELHNDQVDKNVLASGNWIDYKYTQKNTVEGYKEDDEDWYIN